MNNDIYKLKAKIEFLESELKFKDTILNQYSRELLKYKLLQKEFNKLKNDTQTLKAINKNYKKDIIRLNKEVNLYCENIESDNKIIDELNETINYLMLESLKE